MNRLTVALSVVALVGCAREKEGANLADGERDTMTATGTVIPMRGFELPIGKRAVIVYDGARATTYGQDGEMYEDTITFDAFDDEWIGPGAPPPPSESKKARRALSAAAKKWVALGLPALRCKAYRRNGTSYDIPCPKADGGTP